MDQPVAKEQRTNIGGQREEAKGDDVVTPGVDFVGDVLEDEDNGVRCPADEAHDDDECADATCSSLFAVLEHGSVADAVLDVVDVGGVPGDALERWFQEGLQKKPHQV